MFVTNHVLSGVLIGRAFERRPGTAFLVGLGSHLVLDAVPHWGCDRFAAGGPERFLVVAKRDGLCGLGAMVTAALAVDRRARVATVAAMAGAVLLDLDKPCEHFLGWHPFPDWVQRLHGFVQNESEQGMPNEIVAGSAMALGGALTTALARGRWWSGSGSGRKRGPDHGRGPTPAGSG
jgi:hypothetical protein